MANKTVVQLRVYKGAEILKREDGSVKNENWPVKIEHESAQWSNFLNNISKSGFGKVDVEKAIEVENVLEENGTFRGKEKISEVKDISKYQEEVKNAMKGEEKPLTKEEQRIKELEEQNKAFQKRLENLEGGSKDKKETKPKKEENTDDKNPSDDIGALREEYKKLNPEGKGASPKWKADVLKEKIEGFKQNS